MKKPKVKGNREYFGAAMAANREGRGFYPKISIFRFSFFNLNSIVHMMRRNPPLPSILSLPILALSTLIFAVSCEFQSRRVSWNLEPGVTYKLQYAVELRAKAEGSWGASPYVSTAEAGFSLRAVTDSAKAQLDLALTVDTLDYRSPERGPEEDRYMTGRLKKYHAKAGLSRTGQLLSLEEEPVMPPVGFSPLDFRRFLAFTLPSFPDTPIRKGSRWEITQPLLDKFHPGSRVTKRFTLSAIRETPEGELAVCLVEMQVFLDEEVDEQVPDPGAPSASAGSDSAATAEPDLRGSGQMIFNLGKGIPVSTELELEGRFQSRLPQKSGDSAQASAAPLRLQEKLRLGFSR